MDPLPANWRYRLRGDPAPWLLDPDDDPSVYFWFQRDIVGRPEDAPALVSARERILFSKSVQAIFAAQDPSGFWESPSSLDLPRYRATLWTLALLAELGVPRGSRRCRLACEFILQNHLTSSGDWTGLRDLSLSGLLIVALAYFLGPQDERIQRALARLAATISTGPAETVFGLWGLASAPSREQSPLVRQAVERGTEQLLDRVANGECPGFGSFPSFDAGDVLLNLRVLAAWGPLTAPRALPGIERIWERQGENGRWSLETSYNGMTLAEVEEAGPPSKWATLNALRVITRVP